MQTPADPAPPLDADGAPTDRGSAREAPGSRPVPDRPADPFREWVLPETDVMFRVARSLTRNTADAQDLVQETLLRAHRAIDRFDGRYPRAWLLTILRNAHRNAGRKKRPDLLDDPDRFFERDDAGAEAGPSLEERVLWNELDTSVQEAFDALSEDFRHVVELVDLDGHSYQEAADEIGVPIGTVMSRLHRARKRMRDQIVAAGIDDGGSR